MRFFRFHERFKGREQVRKDKGAAHEPLPRSAGFSPLRRPPDQRAGGSHASRQPRPLKRTKVRAPTVKGSRAQGATKIRRNLSMNPASLFELRRGKPVAVGRDSVEP